MSPNFIGTSTKFASYSLEIARDSRRPKDYLNDRLFHEEVRGYLRSFRPLLVAAVGVLGGSFHDISRYEYSGAEKNRDRIKNSSSHIVLLSELIDNVIDGRLLEKHLRAEFVREMLAVLFENYSPRIPKNDVSLAATYQLAIFISRQVVQMDSERKLEGVCRPLVSDSIAQFEAKTDREALELLKKIGRGTTLISAIMSEIIDCRDYPRMIACAKSLGQYFELRDAYADIEEDLKEGTETYFTRRYRSELKVNQGNVRLAKAILKIELLTLIEPIFNDGMSELTSVDAKSVYSAMGLLIDVKYRLAEERGLIR